jgi:LysM repeat protein
MKKIAFSVIATSALATMIAVGDVEASSYTVKSGDSLWKIANANGTSVSQIKKLNNLSTDFIFPNQSLLLSSTAKVASITQVAAPKTVSTSTSSTYTVKSGDTLGRIALQFKTTVASIQSLNRISNHIIYPGQVLKLTGSNQVVSPVSTERPKAAVLEASTTVLPKSTTYIVKSEDSLSKIATLHKTTVASLQQLNNISSHIIHPGQVLKVTGTVQATPATPAPEVVPAKPITAPVANVPGSPASKVYTINSGDTLSAIAYRNRTTVDQLMKLNGLTSHALRIGQTLKIGANGEVSPVSAPTVVPAFATPAVSGSSLYNKVIQAAKSLQGTPYAWGGSTTSGFDCSGFIYYVLKQAGIAIPRTNTTGYDARSYDVANPIPGDLVFFANTYRPGISHMGIYIGNNQFVHAGNDGVQITSLSNSYWSSKFDGFKRLYAVD